MKDRSNECAMIDRYFSSRNMDFTIWISIIIFAVLKSDYTTKSSLSLSLSNSIYFFFFVLITILSKIYSRYFPSFNGNNDDCEEESDHRQDNNYWRRLNKKKRKEPNLENEGGKIICNNEDNIFMKDITDNTFNSSNEVDDDGENIDDYTQGKWMSLLLIPSLFLAMPANFSKSSDGGDNAVGGGGSNDNDDDDHFIITNEYNLYYACLTYSLTFWFWHIGKDNNYFGKGTSKHRLQKY